MKTIFASTDFLGTCKVVASEEVNIEQPFYYVMHHENTQKGIDHFVDSLEANLLAVSMRKSKIFEKLFNSSLSKRMAYQARLPLLVFHAVAVQSESDDRDF